MKTPPIVSAREWEAAASIERVKARMGWTMPWYTMTDGFDTDFGVDEWHGTNAFIRHGAIPTKTTSTRPTPTAADHLGRKR